MLLNLLLSKEIECIKRGCSSWFYKSNAHTWLKNTATAVKKQILLPPTDFNFVVNT